MTEAKVLRKLQPGDTGYDPHNPYKWVDAEEILGDLDLVQALSTSYVRFTDTDGNPVPARNVVIKIDPATGEIIDIVSEV